MRSARHLRRTDAKAKRDSASQFRNSTYDSRWHECVLTLERHAGGLAQLGTAAVVTSVWGSDRKGSEVAAADKDGAAAASSAQT